MECPSPPPTYHFPYLWGALPLPPTDRLFPFPAEKFPQEASAQGLCACLLRVGDAEPRELEEWLTRLVIGVQEDREITGKMADNRLLLQTFATLLVKDSRCVHARSFCSEARLAL